MGRQLADTVSIATAFQIKPDRIHVWASRRKLTKYGKDRAGRTLYDVGQVAELLGRGPTLPAGSTLLDGHRCVQGKCPLPPVPGSPVELCGPHLSAVVNWANGISGHANDSVSVDGK